MNRQDTFRSWELTRVFGNFPAFQKLTKIKLVNLQHKNWTIQRTIISLERVVFLNWQEFLEK